MRFSVIVPIHNEEKYLIYSIPSIYRLKPNEVILLFDRCSDNSFNLANKISEYYNYKDRTLFIEINEIPEDWNFAVAFIKRHGFNLSSNNIILNVDSDMLIDESIRKYISLMNKYSLISFGFLDYPYTIQCFTRRLLSLLITGYAGLYMFNKDVWKQTENLDSVKKVYQSEDSHLKKAIIDNGYSTKYINTNTLHLRPNETKLKHYKRGVAYYNLLKSSPYNVFLHSLMNFRIHMFTGYIHAKSKDKR